MGKFAHKKYEEMADGLKENFKGFKRMGEFIKKSVKDFIDENDPKKKK